MATMTDTNTAFDYAADGFAVRDLVADAHRAIWKMLAHAGSQLDGSTRISIAQLARHCFADRANPPWMRAELPEVELGESVITAVRTMASDAHSIDRDWATPIIEELGAATYVEIGSIVATVIAIDAFAEAIGRAPEPLPTPMDGEPDGELWDDVSDIGAYIDMIRPEDDPFAGPNVGRAWSLVPSANRMFMTAVMSMYSSPAGGFWDMEWPGGPIDRPQAELIATRVSAVNECFY